MSDAINNELAFPCGLASGHIDPLHPGMTLRDYFAAKAMQGMCSSDSYCVDGWAHSDIAVQAYQMADAMLRAREAK